MFIYLFISNLFLCFRTTEETRQTALERQVEYLISMNYERIRDEFIRLDNSHHGTINSNDMRSVIEDLLEFPLRPDEYYQLLKQFPVDENGKILYKHYLKQVLENTNALQQRQKSSAYVECHIFDDLLKIQLKNSSMGIYEIKKYSGKS